MSQGRPVVSVGSREESVPCPPPSFWLLSAVPSVPWLAAPSLQSPGAFSLCVCLRLFLFRGTQFKPQHPHPRLWPAGRVPWQSWLARPCVLSAVSSLYPSPGLQCYWLARFPPLFSHYSLGTPCPAFWAALVLGTDSSPLSPQPQSSPRLTHLGPALPGDRLLLPLFQVGASSHFQYETLS